MAEAHEPEDTSPETRMGIGPVDDGGPDELQEIDDDTAGAWAEADRLRVQTANDLARDRSMVAAGRRIGGMAGAAVAGAMIAVRDIYEGKPKDDRPVVEVESPTDPHDVDRDGILLESDAIGGALDVAVPPQARQEPIVARRRSRRRS
ncbi:MAG: hypothetical protein ABW328_09575 [Ilumatobacteraceae bacterium]